MRLLLLFGLFALASIQAVHGLYFYLDQHERKCFIEDLPSDTVVVGHYMAEEWDTAEGRFDIHDDLGMNILIREIETSHVLTSTRAPSEGKFAFTSHNNGEHEICLSTDYLSSHRSNHGQIRMHLDIIIGDAKPDHSHKNQNHVNELSNRVKDLNALVRDIRREQRYQREREAEFRDLSEKTNSRAVYWSAVQLVVLLCTCLWQLRHLRVFFEDKKLR